jgi:hypothetical protein
LPHLVAELSQEERAKRVRVDTGAAMVADGVGNFLKVRLPIPLQDGRTVVYLAWVYLQARVWPGASCALSRSAPCDPWILTS